MKSVWIKVKSIQRNREEEESIVVVESIGEHYRRNGKDYFKYDETEASGMAGTRTTIKVDEAENTVTLIRKGTVEMRLFYQEGEEIPISIDMPEGVIDIIIKTDRVNIDLENGIGNIMFSYDTSLFGQWELYNEVRIEIQEEQK